MTVKDDLKFLWSDPLFSTPVTGAKIRRMFTLAISEMTGTGLFINIGCATAATQTRLGTASTFLEICLAFVFGIGLAVMICFHISGSVLNPSLSIALVILGHHSIYRWILFTLSQLLGGFLGVLLNFLLIPDLERGYCVSGKPAAILPITAFVYEALHTGLLCWGLCALIDKRRFGSLIHVAMKFMILLIPIILNITRVMGSNLNPAKAFGGAVVGNNYEYFWIYFLGPYTGSSIIAIIYMLFFHPSIEEKAEAQNLPNVVDGT